MTTGNEKRVLRKMYRMWNDVDWNNVTITRDDELNCSEMRFGKPKKKPLLISFWESVGDFVYLYNKKMHRWINDHRVL